MLLRLQKFSFEIHYKKGKDIIFTDHLSHNIPSITGPKRRGTASGLDCISIALNSEELNVSQNHLDKTRNVDQCDLNMEAFLAVIIEGWPEHKA